MLPLTPEAMTLALVLLYKELLEASVARRTAAKRARRPTPPRRGGATPRRADELPPPGAGDAAATEMTLRYTSPLRSRCRALARAAPPDAASPRSS